MEGCLWLENLNGRRFKTFPKRKDPALFFKAEGPFRSFFSFLLTLLLIGGLLFYEGTITWNSAFAQKVLPKHHTSQPFTNTRACLMPSHKTNYLLLAQLYH
jgi:hypothetical protein